MRGNHSTGLAFAIALSVCGILFADDSVPPVSAKETHYNCGVNAAFVAIRSLEISTSVERVARELHAGAQLERDVTMADLKRCFESHGLSVAALKVQKIEQVEPNVAPGGVVVARLGWTSQAQPRYHLVTLLGAKDTLVLIDPPQPVRSVARRQVVRDSYLLNMTGEFLVLSKSAQLVDRAGPSLVLEATEFDAGLVKPNVQVVEVPVNYSNRGSQTLRITEVTGPCQCFVGAEGTKELAPGESGRMVLRLTPTHLPAGKVERTVTLETNDPAAQSVTLTVKMVIEQTAPQHAVIVSPTEINLGRGSVAALMSKFPLDLRITLLGEQQAKPTRIAASSNVSVIGIEQGEDEQRQEADQSLTRIVHFRIVWKAAPSDGPFEHTVTFDIDRSELGRKTVKVPLRGDAIDDGKASLQH